MSKKTQHPLPTIGSQNWGSTLNSYLRNQDYANQEIQQEIEDIYAQQSNVAQTVLSSGVLSDTVDSKRPGLYSKSGQFVTDGELLTFSSTSKYYYKGYAVVFGNSIISELIGGDDGLEIVAPTSTTLSTIDARCVYAYYDISSKAWVLKFGETNDPSTESSISLDPYYICLGVLIKIGGNYYWHYKTMKANLSISSKKWMLDEPHATLSTYMTYNSTDKKIGVYFSETLDGTLAIQALGINPFTSTETATNDLTSDLKTFTLAKKGTTASYSYYILRVDGAPTGSDYIMTSDGVVSNDETSVYRLCATSVTIDGKALLLWQKATSSLDIDRSIFNNTDFSRLWYYCDPVELYRVKGSTMKATVGSGLSPINANGIDPHVTTLIKNTDGVWFGEDTPTKAFHFNTDNVDYPSDYNIVMPSTSDKTNYTSGTILTNTMAPFDGNIAISTKSTTSNRGIILQAGASGSLFSSINKKHQLLLKSYEDTSHYSYIDLADAGTTGHQIEMVVEDGQKHPSILLRGDGYLKLETVDNNKADTTKSKIELFTASNPYMVLSSPELLVNYSGSSTDFIKINPKDSKCIFTKDGDTSVKKSVTFDLSGDSPEIVVGGDAKLSSDGLYLPSGSDGVVIKHLCSNVSWEEKANEIEAKSMNFWNGFNQGPSKMYSYDLTDTDSERRLEDNKYFYIKELWSDAYMKCMLKSFSTSVYDVIDPSSQYILLYGYKVRYHEIGKYFWLYKDTNEPIGLVNNIVIKSWTKKNFPMLTVNKVDVDARIEIVNDMTFSNHFNGILKMASISKDGVINLGMAETLANCGTNHGKIYMGYNGSDGWVEMFANAGQVAINDNQNKIIANRNTYIYKNFCYFDNQKINYASVANTLYSKPVYVAGTKTTFGNSGYLWRIYGFDSEVNVVKTSAQYGAMSLSRVFEEESKSYLTYYTFLPDLGTYNVQFEVYDDYVTHNGAHFPSGNVEYFRNDKVNLFDTPTTYIESTIKDYFIQVAAIDGSCPGIYVKPYVEEDRICLKIVIDANVNIGGNRKAWGFRIAFVRAYDSTCKYYATPVCRMYNSTELAALGA